MEEGGAKAPVTRLRRRLSVEQTDDSKSPTPSTPTKKRGRLAAKPQLDLIDENAIHESPNKKTTRKSMSRDKEAEEKLTPARKSSRIRSNTSLTLDTEEEKLTPGRRSARARSNTSLVEAVPAANTPRAKRAARRTSVLGSDGETALTPTRTRRTRKDSTSSIDVQASANGSPVTVTPARMRRGRIDTSSQEDDATFKDIPTIEVIPEEKDTDRKSFSNPSSLSPAQKSSTPSPNTVRKSPRLMKKSPTTADKNELQPIDAISQEQTNNSVESTESDQPDGTVVHAAAVPSDVKDELSVSSTTTNLINKLDKIHKMKAPGINKSTSAVNTKVNGKESKRHRTKSWTTLSVDSPNDDYFHSDNEKTKRKLREQPILSSFKGLSRKLINSNEEINKIQVFQISGITDSDSKKKKKKSIDASFVENSVYDSMIHKKSDDQNKILLKSPKYEDTGNKSDKENLIVNDANTLKDASNAVQRLFEKEPTVSIQSIEFIEDSDTGTVNKDVKSGDQCVPVIYYQDSSGDKLLPFAIRSNEEEKPDDRSIEPMDIDETMPENVSLTEFSTNRSRNNSLNKSQNTERKSNDKSNNSKRKCSICNTTSKDIEQPKNENRSVEPSANRSRNSSLIKSHNVESQINDDSNKSKRKSSISKPTTKESEQTGNENKSTLVLSELNVSVSSEANSLESLPINNKQNRKSSVSKEFDKSSKSRLSVNETNVTSSPLTNGHVSEKTVNKHALSNCLTSTPVHNKDMKETNLQVNASVITPITEKKNNKGGNMASKVKNVTVRESSDSEDDSDENMSMSNYRTLVVDEAMDAGDDYESGDSQDEEERQYERENEIIDKGETLTSDNDDLSTDSDYEKDSFLVSSDEEDGDLLSGSGEDLNMSDNELNMSKKSKKKYDDRKKKEQKKASREMFEARHQMKSGKESNTQKDKKKNNRQRLDSTLLHSDDNSLPPKKNKRMRLESNSSFAKSDDDKSEPNLDVTKNHSAISVSDGDEIGYKKKKSKRLSDSFCNSGSTLDEKEMTIIGGRLETQLTDDPLTLAIKREPKTPKKLDISTVFFTDRKEIEQIEVPENITIMKADETSDPLQESLAENDDEDESISENEEVIKDYDSMLENLKNQHKIPIKSRDISLNFNNNETKQTTKAPIIEQLNITVSKKIKTKSSDKDNKSKQLVSKFTETEESSSDSMDLKLLFSEDSNDGDKENDGNGEKTATTSEKIIPLKRCEGKTDLRGSISTDETAKGNDLNTSKRKTDKKRKSSQIGHDIITSDGDDNSCEIKFFIDTVGTYGDSTDGAAPLLEFGSKKNKHKVAEISVIETITLESPSTNNSSKKNRITDIEETFTDEERANVSLNSKKHKNRKPVESFSNEDILNDNSLIFNSKKHKKLYESLPYEAKDNVSSSNPKKNKSKVTEKSVVKDTVDCALFSTSPEKKKNKEGDISLMNENTTAANTSKNLSSKKHKDKEDKASLLNVDTLDNISSHTSLKKKKNKKAEVSFVEDVTDTSSKLSKTSKKADQKESMKAPAQEPAICGSETQQYKKKKTVLDLNEMLDENKDVNVKDETSKKKRKRNLAFHATEELQDLDNLSEVVLFENNPTKKPKLDVSDDEITAETGTSVEKQKKRRRRRNKNKAEQDIERAPTTPPMEGGQGKKRKERDEEHSGKKAKVMKKSSLDEIHIPRLPDALLNKLEDKPNKENLESKKCAVSAVATTNFTVETTKRRKNKPSNFLEESVYLNDYESPVPKKAKLKSVINNKPKLLPFIPVASTSDEGFTTNFQVRALTGTMEFQAKNEDNFKTSYLQASSKMKKRSCEMYKKYKKSLSKF